MLKDIQSLHEKNYFLTEKKISRMIERKKPQN